MGTMASALPLLLGAAAVFMLMGKKGNGNGDDTGDGGNGDGNGDDGDDTGNGGGGTIQFGGIKSVSTAIGPDTWKFCDVGGSGSNAAINTNGSCEIFMDASVLQRMEDKLAAAYSALDAADKVAVCALSNPDDPPARVAFISDVTREVWPKLDRPDVVYPPKAGTVSGRDFPRTAYERVYGSFTTKHCGFSN